MTFLGEGMDSFWNTHLTENLSFNMKLFLEYQEANIIDSKPFFRGRTNCNQVSFNDFS